MAGTAKAYVPAAMNQGPGDIWIIGTPPSDSAQRLTLAADGTPDATAHPSSIHLGATTGPITFNLKNKAKDIMADQFDAPIDKFVEAVEGTLEAEMAQQSVDLLQQAFSTGVYSTGTGYKQLTFGGIAQVPSVCVAAIAPKRMGAGLFLVSLLYKVATTDGFTVTYGRAKQSAHKLTFHGMVDITRTAGRQIGVQYETI